MNKRIVLAAGTGFLGECIIRNWADKDTEFILLSRQAPPDLTTVPNSRSNVKWIYWDGGTQGTWSKTLEGAHAVVNLAGRTVNCRYNDKNKKDIIDSRVNSTKAVAAAINSCEVPPKVWINAGSAAIFGSRHDEILTEQSVVGEGFSPQVCKLWEASFNQAITQQTRKVFYRIGMVLGKGGGVLEPFLNLARFGLCGKQGSGQQYISWIHEADFVKAIEFAIDHQSIEGLYNCTSPAPVTNKEFTSTLTEFAGPKMQLPSAAWMIKIGAAFIGTEPELILTGRRVVPDKLVKAGLMFEFENVRAALRELLSTNK